MDTDEQTKAQAIFMRPPMERTHARGRLGVQSVPSNRERLADYAYTAILVGTLTFDRIVVWPIKSGAPE